MLVFGKPGVTVEKLVSLYFKDGLGKGENRKPALHLVSFWQLAQIYVVVIPAPSTGPQPLGNLIQTSRGKVGCNDRISSDH